MNTNKEKKEPVKLSRISLHFWETYPYIAKLIILTALRYGVAISVFVAMKLWATNLPPTLTILRVIICIIFLYNSLSILCIKKLSLVPLAIILTLFDVCVAIKGIAAFVPRVHNPAGGVLLVVFIGNVLFMGIPTLAVLFGRKAVLVPVTFFLCLAFVFHYISSNVVIIVPSIAASTQSVFIIILAYIIGYISEVEQTYQQRSEMLAGKLALANERKRQFLAYASHELKTPLAAMLGYTSCLLDGFDGQLNKEQEDDTRKIASNIRYLNTLIQDFLDLTAIDAEKFEIHVEALSLEPCLREVEQIVAPLCHEKQLQFALDIPKDLPLVNCDYVRLKQVLVNFLGNAMKFTEKGEVSCSVIPQAEHVEIKIRDTGAGIPPEIVPHIFDEYKHWTIPASRKYGGSGLGLAIAKKIIDMHNGKITVESEVGKGSTFTISLLRSHEDYIIRRSMS